MQFSLRLLLMWTTAACCLCGVLTWFFGFAAVLIALILCSVVGLGFLPYLAARLVLTLVATEEQRTPADIRRPAFMFIFCVLPVVLLMLFMGSFLAQF